MGDFKHHVSVFYNSAALQNAFICCQHPPVGIDHNTLAATNLNAVGHLKVGDLDGLFERVMEQILDRVLAVSKSLTDAEHGAERNYEASPLLISYEIWRRTQNTV